jgi:hypothetical protein
MGTCLEKYFGPRGSVIGSFPRFPLMNIELFDCWGSVSGTDETSSLLECDVLSISEQLLTFPGFPFSTGSSSRKIPVLFFVLRPDGFHKPANELDRRT